MLIFITLMSPFSKAVLYFLVGFTSLVRASPVKLSLWRLKFTLERHFGGFGHYLRSLTPVRERVHLFALLYEPINAN